MTRMQGKERMHTVVNDEIRMLADKIAENVPVEKIYLFGSFAYGTPNEKSDYDFYLIIPDDGTEPLDAMANADMAIYKTAMRGVDILAATQAVFDYRIDHYRLERNVAEKGVLVDERK
jgi:predicted nucleotidyltransferase